jgi:DNA-binding NtrC family response regulator
MLTEVHESTERELVQQTLSRHQGKISAAATELGISCQTLYELLEKLGITKE